MAKIPEEWFGAYRDASQYLLLALLLLAVLALLVRPPRPSARDHLYRSRFLVPALGLAALYFVLPEFKNGYFVAERILPLAFMLAVPALPVPSSPVRRRVAALLLGGLLVLAAGRTATGFLRFGAEIAGLEEILDSAEPGQPVAGLMFVNLAAEYAWPPVLIHFPAYYQVEKGGRLHFSFVQFFNSPVRYRPGQNWEDGLLTEWEEWSPHKFSYPRHGKRFRYFLLRGDPDKVRAVFGPYQSEIRVRSAGRWFLIERLPGAPRVSAP